MVCIFPTRQETSGSDLDQRFGAGIPRRSDCCPDHVNHSRYSIRSFGDERRRHDQRLRCQPRPSSNRFEGKNRLADHHAERRQDARNAIESALRSGILDAIPDQELPSEKAQRERLFGLGHVDSCAFAQVQRFGESMQAKHGRLFPLDPC